MPVSPEAVKALQGRPQVNVPSIVSAVPAPVFSPELARMQSVELKSPPGDVVRSAIRT